MGHLKLCPPAPGYTQVGSAKYVVTCQEAGERDNPDKMLVWTSRQTVLQH